MGRLPGWMRNVDLWRDLRQICIHENGGAGCEGVAFLIAQHPLIDEMNKRRMWQLKSAHAFQHLIEGGRVGDELPLVNGYPTAAMLGGVVGKPLEVLRSIGIEYFALAHPWWC